MFEFVLGRLFKDSISWGCRSDRVFLRTGALLKLRRFRKNHVIRLRPNFRTRRRPTSGDPTRKPGPRATPGEPTCRSRARIYITGGCDTSRLDSAWRRTQVSATPIMRWARTNIRGRESRRDRRLALASHLAVSLLLTPHVNRPVAALRQPRDRSDPAERLPPGKQ